MKFAGKVVLITGAGSGIGRATALAFARQGAHLAVLDLNSQDLISLVREVESIGGQCLSFVADVSSLSDLEKSVEQTTRLWGKIDVLFNNAGIELIACLLETRQEDWNQIMDVNLKGAYLLAQAVLPHMVRTGCGIIINNASDAGIRGMKMSAAYSTSKAGLIQLTRSIALDYARAGIRANCICPGCIRTPLCDRFNAEIGARQGRTRDEVLQEFVAANVPAGRVGEPDEVADLVLFLSSEEAKYINGAVIPIDGGLTAGI